MSVPAVLGEILYFIPFFHILFVLFGAPFFADIEWTLLLAITQSLLTIGPIYLLINGRHEDLILLINGEYDKETPYTQNLKYPGFGALVGTWLGACLIPLDWDRWWQRYPNPCFFGQFLGFFAGLLLIPVISSISSLRVYKKAFTLLPKSTEKTV